jgi:hypothetical protein
MNQTNLHNTSLREDTLLKICEVLSAETGINLACPSAKANALRLQIRCTDKLADTAFREFPMTSNLGDALCLLQATNPNKYRDILLQIKSAECLYYALGTGLEWAKYTGDVFPSPASVSGEYYLRLSRSVSFYKEMLVIWGEYLSLKLTGELEQMSRIHFNTKLSENYPYPLRAALVSDYGACCEVA